MRPSLKERFKAEIKKMRAMEFRVLREYIWDYYKLHIIAGLIIAILVGNFLNDTIINPPARPVLTIAWMGPPLIEDASDAFSRSLSDLLEDPAREAVNIANFTPIGDMQFDIANSQRFAAMTAAREIDLIIAPYYYFEPDELGDGGHMMGIAGIFSFMDIKPLFPVNSNTELLTLTNEDGSEINFAPVSEFFLNEFGLNFSNLYLGVTINTRRLENVTRALEIIYGN